MTPQRLWGEVSCECTQMYHYECGSCGGDGDGDDHGDDGGGGDDGGDNG